VLALVLVRNSINFRLILLLLAVEAIYGGKKKRDFGKGTSVFKLFTNLLSSKKLDQLNI